MEINSREVLYKFFKKRNSVGHIFSNDMLFCDIEFKENVHEKSASNIQLLLKKVNSTSFYNKITENQFSVIFQN